MHRFDDPTPLREQIRAWRRSGERIAFVPTMGNLHAGHLSLVDRARGLADRVVASVFVNPTQFGPSEDYAAYPRTLEQDAAFLMQAGCDLLYTPTIRAMYPFGNTEAWVDVPALAGILCGEHRPGHFRGVATVVARLFNQVLPDVAVFGEKDWQQLQVIRRMTTDLAFPIEIVGAPTLREPDGLAMSSRNQYLSPEERGRAAVVYRSLRQVVDAVRAGQAITDACVEGAEALRTAGLVPDYVEVREAGSLLPPQVGDRHLVALTAARLGRARLIDNIVFEREASDGDVVPAV
jgi:pantoate--beta-alanine ligase